MLTYNVGLHLQHTFKFELILDQQCKTIDQTETMNSITANTSIVLVIASCVSNDPVCKVTILVDGVDIGW